MNNPTPQLFSFLTARQFADYSLRTKLIVAFVTVTVLSVGLVTFLTERATHAALIEDVGANLKGRANAQALAVGDLLAGQIDLLRSFGLNNIFPDEVEAINAAYTGDSTAIQAEIEQLDQQWRAADAANNNVDPLVQRMLNNGIASELREYRDIFPDNVEVFATDKYGALVAATNRTSDYYQADEAWWQAAYNNGQGAIHIGQPEFDDSSATFGINIAVPLYDYDSKTVIGILRTTYRLTTLENLAATVQLGQTGHGDLLLPGGQFLEVEASSLTPADPQLVAQLAASTTADYAEFTSFEGAPSLVSQAPVTAITAEPALSNLGWTVVVHQDQQEALAPVEAQTRATVLLALVTVGLAAVVAFGVAQVLARPITRLTAVAQQVAAGDLEIQALVETQDEIGRLAQAFNDMTIQIRHLVGSLEDQVRERTAELVLSMKVGQRALAIRDLAELLPTITEFIRNRFNLYYTQIYFVDDLGQNLVLRAGTGAVGAELLARRHSLPVGPGSIVGRVAAEDRGIVVSDTENSDIHKDPLLPETRSELAVPLTVEGRVIGVLDMQANRANAFTEHNLIVFEAMATQLANAIDSARQWALGQEAQRKADEAIRQLTRQSWIERLASHRENLGFTYDLSAVMPLSNFGFQTEWPVEAISDFGLEHDNGESKIENRKSKIENRLAVSVVVQNESIGQLAVEVPSERAISPDEQNLLAAVAQQLGQKAENLRLFEQTQQRAAREQIARQITDKVRASRDIESALKIAAEELVKSLGVARAVVDLRVVPESHPANKSVEEATHLSNVAFSSNE